MVGSAVFKNESLMNQVGILVGWLAGWAKESTLRLCFKQRTCETNLFCSSSLIFIMDYKV